MPCSINTKRKVNHCLARDVVHVCFLANKCSWCMKRGQGRRRCLNTDHACIPVLTTTATFPPHCQFMGNWGTNAGEQSFETKACDSCQCVKQRCQWQTVCNIVMHLQLETSHKNKRKWMILLHVQKHSVGIVKLQSLIVWEWLAIVLGQDLWCCMRRNTSERSRKVPCVCVNTMLSRQQTHHEQNSCLMSTQAAASLMVKEGRERRRERRRGGRKKCMQQWPRLPFCAFLNKTQNVVLATTRPGSCPCPPCCHFARNGSVPKCGLPTIVFPCWSIIQTPAK